MEIIKRIISDQGIRGMLFIVSQVLVELQYYVRYTPEESKRIYDASQRVASIAEELGPIKCEDE